MSGNELGGRLTEYFAPPWRWCVFVYSFRTGGHACLGQRTAHTALSKAQDIFSQAVCRFDISMATIHQHAAQTALQHQFHLFGDHCRVVNFQRRQQLMGEVMCCLFLLIG